MAKGWTVEPPQQAAPADTGGWSIEEPAPQPSEQPSNFYTRRVEPALKAVGDAGRAVRSAVVGKQDPKFKGVETVEQLLMSGGFGPLPLGELSRAKLAGANDKAYADILQSMLKGRVVARETDANGYPVLTLRADNGELVKGYVNRPGLDWEDVDRGISGAVPYMFGAGAGGKVLGTLGRFTGAPAATQIVGQGLIAGGVNAGQQTAQQGLGSRQPFDFGQVGLATAAGAGGEAIGRVVIPVIRKYLGSSPLVGPDGKLTERGRRIMVGEKLDPDQVDDWITSEIRRKSQDGGNPAEVVRQVTADRFGIPSTKGQRSGDVNQLLIEKDIMASTYGPAARDSLKRVYQQQDDQIGHIARNDGGQGLGLNRNVQTIPEMLNPGSPYARNQSLMGDSGVQAMRTATRNADEIESAAWSQVPRMQPKLGATDTLPRHLNTALKDSGVPRIIPEVQKVAAAMARDVDTFIKGKPPTQDVADWLSQTPIREIDDMRRVLLGHVRNASSQGGDKKAAGAIYKGFMDWVDEAAANKMLTGDAAGAQAMRNAMAATREAREILDGTIKAGTVKGKAATVLQKLQTVETGEGFLNALLGKNTGGKLNEGVIDSLKAYRTLLQKYVPKEQAEQAWNDVRLAYWSRLVTNNSGETHTKTMIAKNIKTAFEQQMSLLGALYTNKERTTMRMLANAVAAINPRDPNPSGSATGIRRLLPGLAKEAAYTQSKRETFSNNNVIAARLWRMLGSTLRTFEKPVGKTVAKTSTSQRLTPRPVPSGSGGLGAVPFGSTRPTNQE